MFTEIILESFKTFALEIVETRQTHRIYENEI